MSNVVSNIPGCCVGSVKKDLVLSWEAPNAKNEVTII